MICKLTPEEEVRMHILLKGIADDPNALEMQKFIQHGSVTTYEHCMRVTRIAFWLNIHLRANADEASLVKGAFLHDFYLYDWKNNEQPIEGRHSVVHPQVALAMARQSTAVDPIMEDCILNHMWPMSRQRPQTKEGWVVQGVDKLCAAMEMSTQSARRLSPVKLKALMVSAIAARY